MFELVKISDSCPEQYDVFTNGKCVGCFRVRFGFFRAEDNKRNTIYSASLSHGLSFFKNDAERAEHLEKACLAILAKLEEKPALYKIVIGADY